MVVMEVIVRHQDRGALRLDHLHNRQYVGRRRSDLIFDHRHNAAIRIIPRGSVTTELLAALLLPCRFRVHQVPGHSVQPFVRALEHFTILSSPGAKLGSHSAKSRREAAGVWTVICPGKQHFANLLDSSRPARGLLHTEEVTGSIPVSPTQLSGRFRSWNRPLLILRQQQTAATIMRASHRACGAHHGWRRTGLRCRSPS